MRLGNMLQRRACFTFATPVLWSCVISLSSKTPNKGKVKQTLKRVESEINISTIQYPTDRCVHSSPQHRPLAAPRCPGAWSSFPQCAGRGSSPTLGSAVPSQAPRSEDAKRVVPPRFVNLWLLGWALKIPSSHGWLQFATYVRFDGLVCVRARACWKLSHVQEIEAVDEVYPKCTRNLEIASALMKVK